MAKAKVRSLFELSLSLSRHILLCFLFISAYIHFPGMRDVEQWRQDAHLWLGVSSRISLSFAARGFEDRGRGGLTRLN